MNQRTEFRAATVTKNLGENTKNKRAKRRDGQKFVHKLPSNPWLTSELHMHKEDSKYPTEKSIMKDERTQQRF